MNYDSLSNFWIVTDSTGVVTACSKYFHNNLKLDQHFLSSVVFQRPQGVSTDTNIQAFNNDILNFMLTTNKIRFRATCHQDDDHFFFLCWPVIENFEEAKDKELFHLLEHPCSYLTDILILKNIVTHSKIKNQKLKQDKLIQLEKEKAALELAKAKSEFLANMSHEIRTPLHGLIGTLQLINATKSRKEKEELLLMAENSSQILMELLNDILDLSKLESRKEKINSGPFYLKDVLRGSANMMSTGFQEITCNVVHDYDEVYDGELVGDSVKIGQIIRNFMSNAIKFTKDGDVKIVGSTQIKDNNECEVTVKIVDNGMGISAEQLPNIFEAFSQSESSKLTSIGGTGLGLSLCKMLIDLLGGQIIFESRYGEGSTFGFRLTLPISENIVNKTEKTLSNKPRQCTYNSASILIVDDNSTNIAILERMLKKFEVDVVCAESGEEAIKIINKRQKTSAPLFPLIFMDIRMPGLSGIETSKIIKEKFIDYDPIILALTANNSEEDINRYFKAGMDDYMPKPFNFDMLQIKLEQYLSMTTR